MTSCDVASVTNKRKRSRVKGGKKAKNSKNLKKGGKEEEVGLRVVVVVSAVESDSGIGR